MSRERSKGIVGIFVLVTILFFIFIVFAFYTVSQLKESSSMGENLLNKGKNSPIAVITIENEIMESKKTIELLLAAEEEASIKAIILRIDSPGGAVAPTQEIYEEVRRIDQTKKPVYASFGTVAASGGYYIGAAARKIWANAGTLTGSIGVIMQTADLSELFKWAKVKQEVIKAGRYKDIGSPARPMSDEERMILNDLLAGTHKQFMQDIMEVRKDRLKKNIVELAQGQIFHGVEAMDLGLVDHVGSLWEAGRAIHKELKLKGEFGLRYLKSPRKKFSFSEFLQETEETLTFIRNKVETQTRTAPAYKFEL